MERVSPIIAELDRIRSILSLLRYSSTALRKYSGEAKYCLGYLHTPSTLTFDFPVSSLGADPIAAMGFSFPVVLISGGLAMGLGIGTSTFVSQALGREEREEAGRIASRAHLLAFALILLLSAAGTIASAFNDNPEVVTVALSYGFLGMVNLTAAAFNGLRMPLSGAAVGAISFVWFQFNRRHRLRITDAPSRGAGLQGRPKWRMITKGRGQRTLPGSHFDLSEETGAVQFTDSEEKSKQCLRNEPRDALDSSLQNTGLAPGPLGASSMVPWTRRRPRVFAAATSRSAAIL